MMERLREGINSIAVKIIIGLICLSFIFAGVGGYIASGSGNAVAKVNGTEILRVAFEQAYTNERNRMQSQMGDFFSTLLADPAYVQSFRRSVLDQMINDVLLEQYADSLGMRVSDNQIRDLIVNAPEFQSNNTFDQERYASFLYRSGFNADTFAEYLRKDMIRQQVRMALQGSEFSLENEVTSLNQMVSQTRDIRSIILNVEEFASRVELSDDELQQYYQANQNNYLRPEQVKVSYIELSAQELKSQITVSDERARAYYEDHIDTYSSQEQRELSHILVQDDISKAQAILDELNSGADFTQLAQQKSEDIGSSEQGGSLGWIEKDVLDPDFEAAAFALQNVGDVTEVVKSDFGYHIIRLDGLKPAKPMPFEEVAAQVKSELVDEEAIALFYDLQAKLEKTAFESENSLDDSAKVTGLSVKNTDFVSQTDAPAVLLTPTVMQAILSPEVKEDRLNSEVIEVAPEHVIVVRVDESREAIVLPYEEVKEQVQAEFSRLKGEQNAMDLAAKVLAALQSGDESVVSANGLVFSDIKTIDRRSPLAQAVFAMAKPQEGNKIYAQTTDSSQNIVIVELNKVSANIDDSFTPQIEAQLVRDGVQQDMTAIVRTLREEADIKYYITDTQS